MAGDKFNSVEVSESDPVKVSVGPQPRRPQAQHKKPTYRSPLAEVLYIAEINTCIGIGK